jgi:hypothetical protein
MFGTYSRLRVHVWSSDLSILRVLIRTKLKPFSADRREARKQIFRAILKEHRDHQDLCRKFHL